MWPGVVVYLYYNVEPPTGVLCIHDMIQELQHVRDGNVIIPTLSLFIDFETFQERAAQDYDVEVSIY